MPSGVYIRSEEYKMKRRGCKLILHKTNPTSFKKGFTPWNKGKSCPQLSGEHHWNWKGGKISKEVKIRHSIEYKLWRDEVFKKDNYTCIWCGKKDELEADHIKPFHKHPELRFEIDNGRTLCRDCHSEYHKLYDKEYRELSSKFLIP